MKRITFGPGLALLLLAGWAGGARADLVNGSFETGDLTGWGATFPGLVSVTSQAQDSFGPRLYGPVEGSHFAYLSTGAGANTSTTLSQFITAAAGDVLRFSVFFDSGDHVLVDEGYASLHGPVEVPLIRLTAGMSFEETKDGVREWPGSTPWTEVKYTFTTPGDYWLVFGVRNVSDNLGDSALGVDNVRLEPNPIDKVPAPSAAVLAGIGACVLWGGRRLRRRSAAASASPV